MPQELVASGEYIGPIQHGTYLNFRAVVHDLKNARLASGMRTEELATLARLEL
jgi:hypothetical protein